MFNKLLIILFTITILFANDQVSSKNRDNLSILTSKEKIWIKNHIITVGISPWYPITKYDKKNKKAIGVGIDFLNLAIKKFNLHIKYIPNQWSILLKQFKEHKIDLLPTTYYTDHRATFGNYTSAYMEIRELLYVKEGSDIKNFDDLRGKSIAMVKSYGTIPKIKKRYPDIKIVEVDTLDQTIQMVLNGEVEAIFNTQFSIESFLKDNFIQGLKPIFQTTFPPSSIHYFTNIKKPILKSIFQKVVNSLSEDEKNKILQKWISKKYTKGDFINHLTIDEKKYLKHNKIIKMCNNPSWEPIEFAKNGNMQDMQGISIDTIKLLEEKLNIKFINVPTKSWSQSQQFLKEKRCDILSSAVKTLQREKYATFTKPYLSYKLAIVTKNDQPLLRGMEDILNKTIARQKGSGLIFKLKEKYPNINIIETKDALEALRAVSNGDVYCTIATLPIISHYINTYSINNLQIAGYTNMVYNLSIAVRNDKLILRDILDKALQSIPQSAQKEIYQNWTNIQLEKKADYRWLWQILGVIIVIVIFVLYRQLILHRSNLLLKKTIKEKDEFEQKLLQQARELETARKKAEEATKVKSDFLANMSHEIRTPMNGILGMTHLVLQTKLEDKQKNYIEKIDSSAKNLLDIINDILDLSKIEAGKLTLQKVEFDLFNTIDDLIAMIEYKAYEKNLELIVNYNTDVGKYYYGDNLRLSQILTNLVSNAIKFTQSGQISIDIKKVAKDRLRFEVTDSGIGMTQDQLEKLFKPFSQADSSTSRRYGGTGLGLIISKQLVELMNGKIWVKSIYEVGSKFIFEIDLEQKQEPKQYTKMFKDKTILVVDDNEAWHKILENILNMFEVKVEHAYGGAEAIDKVINCQGCYDAILMDWNMPQIDGIEATRKLQIECGDMIPPSVIMISSFRQETITKLASNVGIEMFLQKPVNPSTLNNILTQLFLEKKVYRTKQDPKIKLKSNITVLDGNHILVVEDNTINQDIIKGLLEDSGISIDMANNGKEAIELFNKYPNRYKLILMDLQMPIMDGYEATKIIREQDKDIPIVALTANAMKEDIQKTKEASINEHLNKPIDIDKFYKIVIKYLSVDIIQNNNIKNSQILIPNFTNIDTNIGLKLMNENKKLYLEVLKNFYDSYKHINFDKLTNNELKIAIHTIKGLSASIGAIALSNISKTLHDTFDKSLLPEFYQEIQKVLDELKDVKLGVDISFDDSVVLDNKKRDELFEKLKHSALKRRFKLCSDIINDISKYKLTQNDKNLIVTIDEYIKNRKFKQVVEIIDEKENNINS